MEESKTEKVSENVEIAYYEDIAIVYFIGNFHFSSAPFLLNNVGLGDYRRVHNKLALLSRCK